MNGQLETLGDYEQAGSFLMIEMKDHLPLLIDVELRLMLEADLINAELISCPIDRLERIEFLRRSYSFVDSVPVSVLDFMDDVDGSEVVS